jgi:hypothetical protein
MIRTVSGNQGTGPISQTDLKRLLEMMKTVRYGSVTLIIQDGIVIQIDRNEKLRLNKRG